MKYNAIIIGAGLSGLTAAKQLASRGYTVLLLEAKNRVGGRIHSLTTESNQTLEVGADSLSNPNEDRNPLLSFLRYLNLPTHPLDIYQSDAFDEKGERKRMEEQVKRASLNHSTLLERVQDAKEKTWKRYPTLAEAFELLRSPKPTIGSTDFLTQQTLHAMIATHTGASADQVSLFELMDTQEDYLATDVLIGGRFQLLPEWFAKLALQTGMVNIHFNSAVKQIHYGYREKQVRVVTINEEEYVGECVISTLPLGVLKSKTVEFFPPLSKKKQSAISNLNVGFSNKVVLEFEQAFWPEHAHYLFPGSHQLDQWPSYLSLAPFDKKKKNCLVAHFYAKEALFHKAHDYQIIHKALSPLQKAYGRTLPTLKHAYITHWDTDPFALGSTVCYGPKWNPKQELDLFSSENNGLYLAGDYVTTDGSHGTIRGAHLSGLQVAMQVDRYLQRQN